MAGTTYSGWILKFMVSFVPSSIDNGAKCYENCWPCMTYFIELFLSFFVFLQISIHLACMALSLTFSFHVFRQQGVTCDSKLDMEMQPTHPSQQVCDREYHFMS